MVQSRQGARREGEITYIPVCEELLDGDGFHEVWHRSDTGWRHGTYETAVFLRASDETFWRVSYRRSTDGETNGLREGRAKIIQVQPVQVVTTEYEPVEFEADKP